MTEETSQNNPKKALLILVAVIAVILGGVWMFQSMNGSKQPTELQVTEDQVKVEDGIPAVEAASDDEGSITATVEEPISTEGAAAVDIDLTKIMSPRLMGSDEAPIKIIEYASLTCSHCAHFHNDILPILKEKYIDAGSVQFEFREFPLNDPALKATITARCLPEDKYEKFVSLLFKTQDKWAGGMDYMLSLKQNAKLAGLSEGQFEACHANGDIKSKIAESMQEAQDKWKIESTPTFIINDGQEVIKGAVAVEEFERVFRKVSNNVIGAVPAVE